MSDNGPPDIERVDVAVSYRLGEYTQVLRELVASEFTPAADASRSLRFWNGPAAGALVLALVVPPIFLWKKARVGDCVFSFNASGLSRTSKGGTAIRTWAQVTRVRRFSAAYRIELEEGGAMPVPFRVFTCVQQQRFEALLPASVTNAPIVR